MKHKTLVEAAMNDELFKYMRSTGFSEEDVKQVRDLCTYHSNKGKIRAFETRRPTSPWFTASRQDQSDEVTINVNSVSSLVKGSDSDGWRLVVFYVGEDYHTFEFKTEGECDMAIKEIKSRLE